MVCEVAKIEISAKVAVAHNTTHLADMSNFGGDSNLRRRIGEGYQWEKDWKEKVAKVDWFHGGEGQGGVGFRC